MKKKRAKGAIKQKIIGIFHKKIFEFQNNYVKL